MRWAFRSAHRLIAISSVLKILHIALYLTCKFLYYLIELLRPVSGLEER